MLTLENIFALGAAIVTLMVAAYLVRKQNKWEEETRQINEKINHILEDMTAEVSILTGGEPTEGTLNYLERRMKALNESIDNVKEPSSKRRQKNVKFKKDSSND